MKERIKGLSPKIKYVAVLGMVIVALFILSLFINATFFENFYRNKKIKAMISSYEAIEDTALRLGYDSQEFELEFQSISEKNNLSMVVLDYESQILISTGSDYEELNMVLLGYVFGKPDNSEDELLKREERYEIHSVREASSGIEYLDMWGIFENGNIILIRSPMESIREAVRIAGSFLNYILIVLAFTAALVIVVYYRRVAIAELTEKNRQLLTVDAMRTEFLSNVSHELKTPIALIQGYAEGLKESVGSSPEDRDFYCDVIVDEAKKMNTMVKKLLDLSDIEFGGNKLSMEKFDINVLIKNYLQSAEMLCKPKELKVSFNPDEQIFVYADEYATGEVFNNYFINALNHAKEGGRIDIRVNKEDERVRVSVFNEGSPIPEDSLPYIWDKFYKADKARTREYGGSGVGLSIVKAIMEAMNGEYGVKNYEDGVLFYFTLGAGDET